MPKVTEITDHSYQNLPYQKTWFDAPGRGQSLEIFETLLQWYPQLADRLVLVGGGSGVQYVRKKDVEFVIRRIQDSPNGTVESRVLASQGSEHYEQHR